MVPGMLQRPFHDGLTHRQLAVLAAFFLDELEAGNDEDGGRSPSYRGVSKQHIADRLNERYGTNFDGSAVGKALRQAQKHLQCGLLVSGDSGEAGERGSHARSKLTAEGYERARAAYDACAGLEGWTSPATNPTNAVRIVHMSQHSFLVARAGDIIRQANKPARIVSKVFTPRQHSGQSYDAGAYPGLQTNLYDIVIGPLFDEVGRQVPNFKYRALYACQLEAMVAADEYPYDVMPLADLANGDYRLWLPPTTLRTRITFDRAVLDHAGSSSPYQRLREYGTDPPHGRNFIANEDLPLDHQVQAVHDRFVASERWNNNVVVAPSDMAYSFKPGGLFAGNVAERFKWVPIVVDRDGGHGRHLSFWVSLTYLKGSGPTMDAVAALEEVAKEVQPAYYTGVEPPPLWEKPK